VKYFIGLDVHWQHTTVCILDGLGRVVQRRTVRGSWTNVVDELRRLEGPLAVCYEASCGYGYLHDLLCQVAARVVVAHPGHLRLIFRSKRKNDRVDAEKLAKLLWLDEVPMVHVPAQQVRAWRQLIEYRNGLIAKRTRAKNSCRSLLRSVGVRTLGRKSLWTKEGQKWLVEVALPDTLYALRRDLVCREIALLDAQIREVERTLAQFSKDNAAVYLLQSIPGVGPRTAEAVVAYIDNPRRFANNKAIGSYFGLVPSQDQSGSVNRLGHITRQGPASVRRLLTEAAWQGIRRSPTVSAYFQRIQRDDPQRRKLALVATAHYLARVMHSMLRTGELWRERQIA
jgi:transposase